MYHKNKIILFCIVGLISCFAANDKVENIYKKQVVFFPVTSEVPKILEESRFGQRYANALKFVSEIKKDIPTIQCIEQSEQSSVNVQGLIQKEIDNFEKYYRLGLNSVRGKLKLLLKTPWFWLKVILEVGFILGRYFFYKKFLSHYELRVLGISLLIVGFAYFKYLCPCQLFYFWEPKILEKRSSVKNCFEYIMELPKIFLSPLQNSQLQKHVIDIYKTELKAIFATLMQLKQSTLTYTICPMPIFLNSFLPMELHFENHILIFAWSKRIKNLEKVKKLFSPNQKFITLMNECDGFYSKNQRYKNNLSEKLSSVKDPLHGVLFMKEHFFEDWIERDLYQFALDRQAHFIHFDNLSAEANPSFDSIAANHTIFDGKASTALLPG